MQRTPTRSQHRGRTPARPSPSSSLGAPTSEEAIRKRAHEIFLARTHAGQPGSDLTDWYQAERELTAIASHRAH